MAESRTVTENRKARHDFFIEETLEAGIELKGTEVKSLRAGKANLKDSYARIENGEALLFNMHISPFEQGNRYNHDPKRKRKLLLHKSQIRRLNSKVRERGFTLVPLRVYLNENNLVKVELALAKGKRLYDKRREAAKRDAQREIEKAVQQRQKGITEVAR